MILYPVFKKKRKTNYIKRLDGYCVYLNQKRDQYSFSQHIIKKVLLSDSYKKIVDRIAKEFSKYITQATLEKFQKNIKMFFAGIVVEQKQIRCPMDLEVFYDNFGLGDEFPCLVPCQHRLPKDLLSLSLHCGKCSLCPYHLLLDHTIGTAAHLQSEENAAKENEKKKETQTQEQNNSQNISNKPRGKDLNNLKAANVANNNQSGNKRSANGNDENGTKAKKKKKVNYENYEEDDKKMGKIIESQFYRKINSVVSNQDYRLIKDKPKTAPEDIVTDGENEENLAEIIDEQIERYSYDINKKEKELKFCVEFAKKIQMKLQRTDREIKRLREKKGLERM